MRLLAVPLARASPTASAVSTFVSAPLPPSSAIARNAAAAPVSAPGKGNEKPQQLPLATRLLNKASNYWLSLNEPGAKSTFDWKRRTYRAGESLMDRIEYEEWALKGVDPQAGPVLSEIRSKREASASQSAAEGAAEIQLLYPATYLQGPVLIAALRKMTKHRTPHHRSRLIWCLIGMPITIPFALVPIIPNLPFFYLVWRAFSHWRELDAIRPVPSQEMDTIFTAAAQTPAAQTVGLGIYDAKGSAASSSVGSKSTGVSQSQAAMVLQARHVDRLAQSFSLSAQTVVDLNRARLQTQASIEKGELAKLLEAAKGIGGSAAAQQRGAGDEKRHDSPTIRP
ncbi:hypothetical protein IE81DRAFT_293677 [Ceraceosorus guamensis]|uniref:Mitochondrial K+-H+ exchange-related-domain-containing protein n=1 Tax=Ceraceosorus guamensis TaxID=1522189 RepID=A0A316VXN7_9BASI|nr:hypothetical protein IE81DRAFT_293677 [Ceraceosorus guamensis]PWN40265.1 hypothetical protein IE81DRAFT_293677 [Ceraceosorus guamensis]